MRRFLLSSAILLGASALAAQPTLAADDGFFTVNYSGVGFDLTQIGGYGELVVRAEGYKNLSFGSCTLNFTRDAEGRILEKAPVVQASSAACPEALDFTLSEGKNGLKNLTFTEGGPLKGETFDLYPVLVPMREDLRITAPKGFDVLGLTIGQTRSEIEAALTQKGYSRLEAYEETSSYQGGFTKGTSLWGKGKYQHDADKPADMIALSWTAVFEGEAMEEKAEYIVRNWRIPPEENLSVANLRKSLDDKHGKTTSGFEARFYDRAGTLEPKSFQAVCAKDVHLQQVSTSYALIGEGGEEALPAACGSEVRVMVGEDYAAKGRASYLRVALVKADTAFESFWTTWSRGEVKALQQRFELQSNMTGSSPDL